MSGFRFGLQKLLDLRSRAEDQAHSRLAESQRESAREQAALAACREAWARTAREAGNRPGGRDHGAALLNTSLHLGHLHQQAKAQQGRVEACERQETARRESLLETARERQVIANLKSRRWEQYVAGRDRAEQRVLDEAGLLTHQRQRAAQ